MTKGIQSYNDLLEERKRLEALLQIQRETLRSDVDELKATFRPVVSTISEVGKIFTREKGNILMTGLSNWLIDLLFKKFILAKTNWLTRQAVPFFLKNYSSHFVAEHKNKLLEKLFSLFAHKNGQDHVASEGS